MIDPDVRIDSALVDAEQELVAVDRLFHAVQTRHLVLAAREPPGRAGYGFGYIVTLRMAGWTLVKGHSDR